MISFALVGCGHAGALHAEAIKSVGTLAAVCDVDEEKATGMATQHGAAAYNTFEVLLEKEPGVEVVVIATPTGYHAEHIIKSLQKRKHVLCEQPLCLTTAAAWQIIETEKFCRRQLFLVQPNRHNPVLGDVKKALDEGLLGHVHNFQVRCSLSGSNHDYNGWKGKLFPGGGLLYTPLATVVDALVWLIGEIADAKGFKAVADQSNDEIESGGAVALQMQNGSLGTLNWSLIDGYKSEEFSFTLFIEKGTIRLAGESLQELQFFKTESDLRLFTELEDAGAQPRKNDPAILYNQTYQRLATALAAKDKTVADAFDGLNTVAAIETIYKAILHP